MKDKKNKVAKDAVTAAEQILTALTYRHFDNQVPIDISEQLKNEGGRIAVSTLESIGVICISKHYAYRLKYTGSM